MKMKIQLLDYAVGMPMYATDGSSGLDLQAAIIIERAVFPEEIAVVPTGIQLSYLDDGYELQIRPRSGLSAKGMAAKFGTIDNDYRGEIKVIIQNTGCIPYTIKRGDRIAQIVPMKVERATVEIGPPVPTSRGEGGFGSTGA